MQFGVFLNVNHVGRDGGARDELVALANVVEEGRWTSAWVSDHLMASWPGVSDKTHDSLDPWAVLAALAAHTSGVRLGTLVNNNLYRHPSILAKMVATVDWISGGRVTLGLGAGWDQHEAETYGIRFPDIRERFDRLDETCAIVRLLFDSDDAVSFEGKYSTLDQVLFSPRPKQDRLPLLIGGVGEQRTLRILARYGDAMNFTVPGMVASPEAARAKFDVLAVRCEEIGRDPAEIRRTIITWMLRVDDPDVADRVRAQLLPDASRPERSRVLAVGSAREIIEVLERYREAGVQEIYAFGLSPHFHSPETLRALDQEVLAAFD